MRTRASVLALVLASSPALAHAQPKTAPPPKPASDDLARARALDQQGAKAYADGRYNDAIRYFEEAFRLGGPAFEQWNIAKCHLRLDQPEQAADMLEKYLATPNLPAEDQREAQEQLDELRKRSSTLTVSSSPSGATVTVDGKPAPGKTPLSVTVGPGPHAVAVSHPNHAIYNKQVEARYGRAIILDAPLDEEDKAPAKPYGAGSRWAVSAWLGVDIPNHGSVSGSVEPGGLLAGTYRFANVGPTAFAVGGAILLTGDAWSNTVGAPTRINGCPSLDNAQSATATSLFGIVTAGWELAPRFRAHVVGGAGAALYFTGGAVGGDLFTPNCNTGTLARPALLGAAQLDYNVTPLFRVSMLPIAVQLHQAFEGARTAPLDATGLWFRALVAIGAGFDFE